MPEPEITLPELGERLYSEFQASLEAAAPGKPPDGTPKSREGRLRAAYGEPYSRLGILQQAWLELARRLWHPDEPADPPETV